MKSNFESIYNMLRDKGIMKYPSYADYVKATEPAQEGKTIEESIKNQEIKNEEEPPKERFEDSLPPKEREQFLKMFSD